MGGSVQACYVSGTGGARLLKRAQGLSGAASRNAPGSPQPTTSLSRPEGRLTWHSQTESRAAAGQRNTPSPHKPPRPGALACGGDQALIEADMAQAEPQVELGNHKNGGSSPVPRPPAGRRGSGGVWGHWRRQPAGRERDGLEPIPRPWPHAASARTHAHTPPLNPKPRIKFHPARRTHHYHMQAPATLEASSSPNHPFSAQAPRQGNPPLPRRQHKPPAPR